MTYFLRLLEDNLKISGLQTAIKNFKDSKDDHRLFSVDPQDFFSIPTAPFAYWINTSVREAFIKLPKFEEGGRTAKQGLATADDFRFVRTWWEISSKSSKWRGFAKGGAYSPFYSDVYLVVNWQPGEKELWSIINPNSEKPKSNIWMLPETIRLYFFRPGITWPRRTKSKLSMRILPSECIFADKGPAIFADDNNLENLAYTLSISTSRAFQMLVETQLAAADAKAGGAAHSFEAGVIQRTPVPTVSSEQSKKLASLAYKGWWLRRQLDSVEEISHAFSLPILLLTRLGSYDPIQIEAELARIQSEINAIAFELYGFSQEDHILTEDSLKIELVDATEDDFEDEDTQLPVDMQSSLLSWAVGVSFGRFDWRLATREREAPLEPEPFDPLPAKSPGMLPDGAESLHRHLGILVDDPGHPHDLPRLIEDVLERVDIPAPGEVRRWLQKDFWVFHLQRYSKSRRKAPIYWPLSTNSGGYTLWLYYPSLTSQTLYTAINDFVEPKLKQVGDDTTVLRNKGAARSREDEKQFEALQAFELELIELRDTLLNIAQTYLPNHDDGVQITAAPLWPLFRHKPWQKLLKDTWAKLEKGEYDWAHLAMNYWPERVREKCKTDKSLAIAHGLEELYIEPEAKPKKTRGKKAGV